ncbi:MAG: hypothetical protein ACE14L_01175 [Terriglobales bacterium]
MTAVDVCFRLGTMPDEAAMRGIDRLWEVYGIRRIQLDEADQSVRVEFDSTRFTDAMVASLLRRAGVDVREKLVLA